MHSFMHKCIHTTPPRSLILLSTDPSSSNSSTLQTCAQGPIFITFRAVVPSSASSISTSPKSAAFKGLSSIRRINFLNSVMLIIYDRHFTYYIPFHIQQQQPPLPLPPLSYSYYFNYYNITTTTDLFIEESSTIRTLLRLEERAEGRGAAVFGGIFSSGEMVEYGVDTLLSNRFVTSPFLLSSSSSFPPSDKNETCAGYGRLRRLGSSVTVTVCSTVGAGTI